MAKPLAGLTFEEAAEHALDAIGARGLNKGVTTSKLGKTMRRLGYPMNRDKIIEKLFQYRNGMWGRRYAYYIGGTNDQFDAFAWTIQNGA